MAASACARSRRERRRRLTRPRCPERARHQRLRRVLLGRRDDRGRIRPRRRPRARRASCTLRAGVRVAARLARRGAFPRRRRRLRRAGGACHRPRRPAPARRRLPRRGESHPPRAPDQLSIRRLRGGYEVDDARERVDRVEVHRFLSEEAYWAPGRTRATQDRLIDAASRVVGLYYEGEQVGFCRAFTDGLAIAYLADVYVRPEHRGRGLGEELVREMIDNGPYGGVKWLLHTTDAHALYRKFGFGEPSFRVLERRAPGGS